MSYDYEPWRVAVTERKPAWHSNAKCKVNHMAPVYFFPGTESIEAERAGYCGDCPVNLDCLEYALATVPEWGIWGGSTTKQRTSLVRSLRTQINRTNPATVEDVSKLARDYAQKFFAAGLPAGRRGRKPQLKEAS